MKVKEFLTISDEDEILKLKAIKESLKGRNFIGNYKCKDLIDYSFKKVLSIKDYYAKGNLLFLCSSTLGIGHKELLERDYRDLVFFLKYIEEGLEKIESLERNLNKPDDTDAENNLKLEAAGISELSKFEELNIIDELADGDILKWQKIENMPYKMIYIKLLKNKTKATIQRRYQELNKKTK